MPIQRVPFAQPVESRDGSAGLSAKDSFTYNLFFDTVGHDRFVQKRPCATATTPQSPATPFVGSQILAYQQLRRTTFLPDQVAAYVVVTGANAGLYYVTTAGVVSFVVGAASSDPYIPTNPSMFFVDQFKVMLVDQDVAYLLDASGPAISYKMAANQLAAIQVTNPGSKYLNPVATLSITASPASVITAYASGTSVRSSGAANINQVQSIALTTQGGVYTVTPSVTITDVAITATVAAINSPTKVKLSWDTTTASDNIPVGTGISGTGVPGGTVISTPTDGWISLSAACALTVGQTVTLTGIGTGATAQAIMGNLPRAGGSSCYFNNRAIVYGKDTQKLYASNVGTPTYFDPLNFVSAESYVDYIRGIVRHLNYVVAFGEFSCQFFYDNGNSTGNSLSPALSYNQEVGLFSEVSMAEVQNSTVFVGQTMDAGIGVYLLSGASIEKISVPAVDRILKANNTTIGRGLVFYSGGHTFYAIHYKDTDDCLVFDMTEKSWHVWNFPVYFSHIAEASNTNTGTYYYGAGKYDVQMIAFGTNIYQDSVYNASGVRVVSAPSLRSQTDILDGGVTKRKFFRRAEAIGNKTTGTMTVEYSDDDYNTWAGGRTVDLAASRSQMYGLGQSRRRAFRFTHQANQPFRLLSMELQYDIGELENDGVIEPVYRR